MMLPDTAANLGWNLYVLDQNCISLCLLSLDKCFLRQLLLVAYTGIITLGSLFSNEYAFSQVGVYNGWVLFSMNMMDEYFTFLLSQCRAGVFFLTIAKVFSYASLAILNLFEHFS